MSLLGRHRRITAQEEKPPANSDVVIPANEGAIVSWRSKKSKQLYGEREVRCVGV